MASIFDAVRSSSRRRKTTPWVRPTFSEHHFAEVLVVSDQDPVTGEGLGENILVSHSTSVFVNREHIVRLLAQPPRDGGPCTLVDQKSHLRELRSQWHECRVCQ